MKRDAAALPGGRRLVARLGVIGATVALAVLGVAAPAQAHVTITPSTTAAGAYAVLEVSVPHGCQGSSTTGITIQLPDEIVSVTPTRHALWEVEKNLEQLDPPVTDSHGRQVTERVASVTYRTDSPLPEGYRDVLELSLLLPDLEGETLVFPTIQTCEQGESAWIEVPAEGQDGEALELPAPSFVLTAAADDGDGAPAVIDTSLAADDGSEVADETGAVDPWTIGALVVGLVGAGLGGTALVLQRRRA